MQDQPPRFPLWLVLTPVTLIAAGILVVFAACFLPPTPSADKAKLPKPDLSKVPVVTSKDEPQIRVNVTPGGADSFRLEVRGRYRLKLLDSDEPATDEDELGLVTVTAGPVGLLVGSRSLAVNRVEIEPERSPAIRVNGHLYRGNMRLLRRTDGKVSAVNVLPIEDYLASVVDSEMPGKFPEEARMAQAIVARTYALYQIQQADPNSQYDLLSSQRSQKYLGYEYLDASDRRLAGESPGGRRSVNATRGIVYQYDGKIFCTYYSAACGGQTTNGQQVFKDASDSLASVTCEWCSKSPFYRWTREIPLGDFQQRIWDQGSVPQEQIKINPLIEPGTGAIPVFELDNGMSVKKLSGIELRDRLPSGLLLSPQFTIKLDADRVIFEGRGYGHGVGFCQWGAKGQADAGRSCYEIVRHYYPGSKRHVMMY